MPRFVYSHIRAAYGYEPGDEVSAEFAAGHLSLVTEIPDKPAHTIPAPKAAQEADKDE